MLELERQGLELIIFPLKSGQEQGVHGEFRLLQAPLVYVPVRFNWLLLRGAMAALQFFHSQSRSRFLRLAWRFLRTGKKERDFSLLNSFLRWLWLARQLRERKLANLHAHFAHDPATMAYWCAQLLGINYSFTAHAKDIYCYSQAWLKEKIHHARFVVTCTDYNRKYLQSVSQNGTPIHCLYHGLNTGKFQPSVSRQTEQPLVLAVGRLVEKKGFSFLIEACALLRQQGISFQCEIVGEGPLRASLQAQIERLRLTQSIRLLGAMSHQ
jgi:glycosyltransferase involved in cell wall biosynthesis